MVIFTYIITENCTSFHPHLRFTFFPLYLRLHTIHFFIRVLKVDFTQGLLIRIALDGNGMPCDLSIIVKSIAWPALRSEPFIDCTIIFNAILFHHRSLLLRWFMSDFLWFLGEHFYPATFLNFLLVHVVARECLSDVELFLLFWLSEGLVNESLLIGRAKAVRWLTTRDDFLRKAFPCVIREQSFKPDCIFFVSDLPGRHMTGHVPGVHAAMLKCDICHCAIYRATTCIAVMLVLVHIGYLTLTDLRTIVKGRLTLFT